MFSRPVFLMAFLCATCAVGQDVHRRVTFGPGIGIDHGGIGVQLAVPVDRYMDLFLGAGSAIIGVGFNAGVQVLMAEPGQRFIPFATIMYGYNGFIEGFGINKIYYGLSPGLGCRVVSLRSGGYVLASVIYPIRSSEFKQELERNPALKAWPVLFSLGYQF